MTIEQKRHSLSHILAQAVLDMFPEAKLGIGPDIDNGFYYDFELPRTLIPEDLPILEKKMKHIIKQNQKFEQYTEPVDKAVKFLKTTNQDIHNISDIKGRKLAFGNVNSTQGHLIPRIMLTENGISPKASRSL